MNRLSPLLVPLAFVAAAIVVGSIFRYPLVTDDPFITYRYAQNVLNGTGFVFNAGERVLSTTTPLYAILLAFLGFFYREIPALGYWISVASFGVTAGLLYAFASRLNRRAGGILAGVLLLLSPALVATYGLETGFYLMWGVAALYAYAVGRVSLAFAFAALLTLTRNDGLVLVGILTAHYFYAHRAALFASRNAFPAPRILLSALRPLIVYFAILLPYLVFSTLYFGSPFPFTLAAKIAQAQSGLWDPFAPGLVKWFGQNAGWLAPQLLFAGIGIVGALRARALVLLVAAWALGHIVAYAVLGVAFYPWYVAPLLPALCLFAGLGVDLAARRLAHYIPVSGLTRAALLLAGAALLLAVEVRATIGAGMLQPSPKVQAYERAAGWLAQNAPENARVDALEVGVIGFYDRHPTYDFVGLVDPMRIPYLRTTRFADGVRRRAADYVVAIPPDTWLPGDVWFKDAYTAVEQIRVPGFYNNRPLVIYRRAGAGQDVVESRGINVAFEKKIELSTVDLYAHEIARGAVLPLRLNLRALDPGPVPEAWKFTIQLVGAENRVIAQTDNFYPARLPEDAMPFADYQGVPVPPDAPPGTYALILAMYDVQNAERLSFYSAEGQELGDFVPLGDITIQ